MLPKFAYKFWKVYDRFFDGTKPGLPGAIPATKYFSQIIKIYKGVCITDLTEFFLSPLSWT